MSSTPLYIPVLEERKKFKDYRYDVWGESFSWYKLRSWETIKYLVIHHSVTNPTNNHKSDVDYIAELHKRRGWAGIGYHFVITADGTVWYVGDISVQRANVADKNHLVIGICLVGDFRDYNPTDEQILSAHDLCKYLLDDVPAMSNLVDWKNVVGHKFLQATMCPGPAWKGPGDSMYERIKNRVPYTPQPEPEPTIDWEKKYKELKTNTDVHITQLKADVLTENSERTKTEGILAKHKVDCQKEITTLTQKLKNANLENPKIPELSDFPDKEIFDRSLTIVVNKVLNYIKPLLEKFKNYEKK